MSIRPSWRRSRLSTQTRREKQSREQGHLPRSKLSLKISVGAGVSTTLKEIAGELTRRGGQKARENGVKKWRISPIVFARATISWLDRKATKIEKAKPGS